MAILQKKPISNIISPKHKKERGTFLKRLGALLEEGYSLKKSLKLLNKLEINSIKKWIREIEAGLKKGKTLHEELEKIGFSKKTCSQIYLASQYGDYGKSIRQCGEDLLEEEKFKKRIQSLLAYPLILLFFLFSMIMIMRFLVLPNMESLFFNQESKARIYSNLIVRFIYYSPQLILITFLLSILLVFILKNKLANLSYLEKIRFFVKWPFIKKYFTYYWTNFLFLEWGNLLKKGMSFQELIQLMMGEESSTILRETAEQLSEEMIQGKTIKEGLKTLPFFDEEGLMVISHGEDLGHLAIEMIFYAKYCEEELSNELEKILLIIQPLIFIFIALMIIAIYASMILPIYTMMEGI